MADRKERIPAVEYPRIVRDIIGHGPGGSTVATYIYLREAVGALRVVEVEEGINVDYDTLGQAVGVEIIE